MAPEKHDPFDVWETSFRQRFGTLQARSGNGASPDRGWQDRQDPVVQPQQARRRASIVSSLGMIAALLVGLVLGAALWRDRAGATSIRVVTQTSITASPNCKQAVDHLERRLAQAADAASNPTGTTGIQASAAAGGQPAGLDTLLADYRNTVEQCGLE